jgi:hypothetical protein
MKGHSKRFWLLTLAVVAFGLAALGGAYAASGKGPKPPGPGINGSPSPTIGGPDGTEVLGTTKGMPPTAQVFYGVVNADGTVSAQRFGISSATKLSTGTYQINMGAPITACAYVATLGLSGNSGTSAPGSVTVVGRVGTTNGIFLQTFNSTGGLADHGFHLVVTC